MRSLLILQVTRPQDHSCNPLDHLHWWRSIKRSIERSIERSINDPIRWLNPQGSDAFTQLLDQNQDGFVGIRRDSNGLFEIPPMGFEDPKRILWHFECVFSIRMDSGDFSFMMQMDSLKWSDTRVDPERIHLQKGSRKRRKKRKRILMNSAGLANILS